MTARGSRKPKLLLCVLRLGVSGTARLALTLAGELEGRGWEVHTIFPRLPGTRPFLSWCREQGVVATSDPAVRRAHAQRSAADVEALGALIRRIDPDIVNFHYPSNFIWPEDIQAVRLAGTARCIVSPQHPTPWTPASEQRRLMTGRAGYMADAVVVTGAATRSVLHQAGVPAERIHLIPCGVPEPAHRPTRSEARERLGLPDDAFVIATLARLQPYKGVGTLLEAAALLPDPHHRLRVVVGGDGPQREALQEQAESLLGDRALFLGRIAETADLYAGADLFVLPSILEAFGLVYVEAAFHGVPSIGAHTGGTGSAIAHGQTGLLVDPGDAPGLARAIESLRSGPSLCRRMGQAARERALAAFTSTRMADGYEQLFRRMLADGVERSA
jgi:glycosyltransferase involved in cell wall biosynthesis